jgi:hypothetical protein
MAIVTALLFFFCMHRRARDVACAGLPDGVGCLVRSITLFALGGVAQLEKDLKMPRQSFWSALCGPIASAVIGFVCLLLAWVFGWRLMAEPVTPLCANVVWLGYINIVLAVFNLLPRLSDGRGRVASRHHWWRTVSAKGNAHFLLTGSCRLCVHSLRYFRFFGGRASAVVDGLHWLVFANRRRHFAQQEAMTERPARCARWRLMTRDCTVVTAMTICTRSSTTNYCTLVDAVSWLLSRVR